MLEILHIRAIDSSVDVSPLSSLLPLHDKICHFTFHTSVCEDICMIILFTIFIVLYYALQLMNLMALIKEEKATRMHSDSKFDHTETS